MQVHAVCLSLSHTHTEDVKLRKECVTYLPCDHRGNSTNIYLNRTPLVITAKWQHKHTILSSVSEQTWGLD
jgi:hypothetical protein